MTDLKPKVFIGSSTPGYEIASKVKTYLSETCDCYLWKESGIWEPGRSSFENLLRAASYFDFGVFVATADDLTRTEGKLVIEARDNVILEMALFCGSMGRDKSFLLVEHGVKLPSDFDGIYNPRFSKTDEKSITNACNEYKNKIIDHYRLGHLSLYPTTALAIGYYKNFVKALVESAQDAQPLIINDVEYSEFKLKVIIPENLEGLVRERARQFYKRHGLIENTLQTKFRKHPAWFQLDPHQAPVAAVYDMPSTLTGIDDAIEMILQKNFVGRSKMQEIIEQRELNNFKRVLQMELNKSPFAKATVEIIDEF